MKIITRESIAEIKIERSQFIGHLNPVTTSENAKDYIKNISKKHNKAHHNCWAYVLGEKGEIFHSSDNGEPSGTAGKPMLRILQQNEITNVVAVVTRYFGGVKLGVRGLIDAYSQAIEKSVLSSDLQPWLKKIFYTIKFDYAHNDKIFYELQKMGALMETTEYLEHVTVCVSILEEHQHKLDAFLCENKTNLIMVDKNRV